MTGFLKNLLLRKLQEKSTWAGIISLVCGALGWNASPEMQQALLGVAMAAISLGMVALNERKGPNPQNAPLLPPDLAPVVVQLPGDEAAASGRAVPSRPDAGVRPAVLDDGSPAHPPVRPGFGPRP